MSKRNLVSTSPRGSPVNHWMVSVAVNATTQSNVNSTSTSADVEEDISERMLGRILSETSVTQVSGSSSDVSVAEPLTIAPSAAVTTTTAVVAATGKLIKRPPVSANKKKTKAKQPPLRRGNHNNKTPPKCRSHTRSTAGDVQLLTGVTHQLVSSQSSLKSTNFNTAKTRMVGSNDKGIVTTRNGLPVTKVPMNTGILFIYKGSRQVEFVRTK